MVQPVEADQKPMFCIGCGYNLRGLTQPRCPECSRAFDPDDSLTFLPQQPRRNWLLLLLTAVAAGYPILFIASFYLTWIAGWIELGRPPRFYRDDPAGIHGLEDVVEPLPILIGWALCPAFGLAVLMGVFGLSQWLHHLTERPPAAKLGRRCVLIILAAWLGGFVTFAADPLGVVRWYAD